MTIKTTLFQLENTSTYLNNLAKCPMSGIAGRKVIKISQEIFAELEILDKSKQKLFEKYKEFRIDLGENKVSFGEKQEEFMQEYIPLLNQQIELKSEKLSQADIESIQNIVPEILINLKFLQDD